MTDFHKNVLGGCTFKLHSPYNGVYSIKLAIDYTGNLLLWSEDANVWHEPIFNFYFHIIDIINIAEHFKRYRQLLIFK